MSVLRCAVHRHAVGVPEGETMTTIQRSFGWKGRLGAVAATSTLGVVVSTGLTGAPAFASDNQKLTASRSGVSATLTVDWINSNTFVLRDVSLSDTGCDS